MTSDTKLQNIRNRQKSFEVFRTPAYSYFPLFDYAPEWFTGRIIDPSAGDGRMVGELVMRGNVNRHLLLDIREEENLNWKKPQFSNTDTQIGDYLKFSTDQKYNCLITNPPFTLAQDFVEHARSHVTERICILQSVSWIGTQRRSQWLKTSGLRYMLNLPKRPRWEMDNGDKPASNIWDFAWYVFEIGYKGKAEIDWLL